MKGPLSKYGVRYNGKTRSVPASFCFLCEACHYLGTNGLSAGAENDPFVDGVLDFAEWLEKRFETCAFERKDG